MSGHMSTTLRVFASRCTLHRVPSVKVLNVRTRIANVSTVPLCLALELLTLGCDVWRSAASRSRGVCAHPNKQKIEFMAS
eukprot:573797-Prymnesium_polylepis.2